MESLSVRLASGNACHYYRTKQQNFANKSTGINGMHCIDNDLMWIIQYRKCDQLSPIIMISDIREATTLFPPNEFRRWYSKCQCL